MFCTTIVLGFKQGIFDNFQNRVILGQLNIPISYEDIYGGSYYNNEAPHILYGNFWRSLTWLQKQNFVMTQIEFSILYLCLSIKEFWQLVIKVNWNFLNILEIQNNLVWPFWAMHVVWKFRKGFGFLCFNFQVLLYFSLANFRWMP